MRITVHHGAGAPTSHLEAQRYADGRVLTLCNKVVAHSGAGAATAPACPCGVCDHAAGLVASWAPGSCRPQRKRVA